MERFKEIIGYEGLYEVSDLGRVRNVITNLFLKPQNDGYGYYKVTLTKNKIKKQLKIHRLVYYTFHPERNPDEDYKNGLEVNHINENIKDNRLCNLELLNHKDNMNYGTRTIRASKSKSKSILQYDLNNNFIKEWDSFQQIKNELGYSKGNICLYCNGKRKSAYGFIWKYKNL